MTDRNDYLNLDNLPGAPVQRIKIVGKAPKIRFGYKKDWNTEKKLEYAEKMATSYHHAAQLLQGERDNLITIANHQENQLVSNIKSFENHQILLNKLIEDHNKEKQVLLTRLAEKDQAIAELKR